MGEANGRPVFFSERKGHRGKTRIALISLGCPKNLVDSEKVLGFLSGEPIILCPDPRDAEVVLINTCAFIEEARREARGTILEASGWKKQGKCKAILVLGCLVKRRGKSLEGEFPEVDAFLGFSQYPLLPSILKNLRTGEPLGILTCTEPTPPLPRPCDKERVLLTPSHYGYLRIAEGCDNCCSYCTVPSIRGVFRSKPQSRILEEARMLAGQGVKEINVIAQDTTSWGKDLPWRPRLPWLLESLSRIRGILWIRLLYTHPAFVDEKLIFSIAENEKICKYIDLPIQHIHDGILSRMGRKVNRHGIEACISALREKVPGIFIRTSLIVGFPGEGRREFEELLEFVRSTRFERLGAFRYSVEEGTLAAGMKGRVPRRTIESRYRRLMSCQQAIAFALNRTFEGREIEVLVDHVRSKNEAIGRSQWDAPDIDPCVHIRGRDLRAGQFTRVRITGSRGYDLEGEAFLP